MLIKSILSDEITLKDPLLLLIIGLVTYVAVFYYRYFTRSSPLPGPIPLPIVGNVLQYPGDAGKWLNQLRQIYGDMFEIYVGTTRTVCLCREDLIDKLTSSSSTSNFHLRTPPNDGLGSLGVIDKGIFFNRNYDDWSYHRRFLQKTIMSPQLAKETVESTQDLFQEMEGLWKRLGYDKEIDFIKWATQFTFENTVLLTTTLRVYALTNYYNTINPKNKVVEPEGTLPNSVDYVNSIRTFFESLHFFLLTPKLVRYLPGVRETTNRLLKNRDWLVANLLEIIKARRAQIESSEEKIDTHDLLTQLLTINTDKDVTRGIADDKHTERMSDDYVRANMMEIIGTGTLTTANTFCYIVYYLARYPEVKKRMVKELDDVLGNDHDSHITIDQIHKLEYTDAVFKEVSRIFPTVPVNVRTNIKPEEIAGHNFPENTQFLIDMEGIHHSSSWSDPGTFNPDRWLTSSDSKRLKNTFFQFGSGSRICPGKNLALAEVKTLMALLYRKYDVELVDKVSPVKYDYRFIKSCDELKVKIKPRN